ncbi:RNA polymerase sigma factor [Azospirillum sp. sgz301742]
MTGSDSSQPADPTITIANTQGSGMSTSFNEELLTCIPELQRYARKLAGDHAAAEDLVQDCLERGLRNADKFEPGTNLEAWLMTILKHLFFTECRRCQRRPHVELDEHDSIVPPPQIARIALDEVGEAISALPPRQRGLIELVTIDGVSYQDAAQRLGVPVGTIRSRLSRTREQIRHNMERRRRIERPPRAARLPAASPQRVRSPAVHTGGVVGHAHSRACRAPAAPFRAAGVSGAAARPSLAGHRPRFQHRLGSPMGMAVAWAGAGDHPQPRAAGHSHAFTNEGHASPLRKDSCRRAHRRDRRRSSTPP